MKAVFKTLTFFLCFSSTLHAEIMSLPDYLLQDERNTIQIFHDVSHSVVNISNLQYERIGFFSSDVTEVPTGTGTGFVWDETGYIVTNFHVVQNADRLLVSFKDASAIEAELVGVEPRKDVAVLKLKKKEIAKFKGIARADSSKLFVGQKAVAIGNPFGLDQSLSQGVVSALGRSILGIGGVTIRDMVQTDAAVNPGNSGGPLLDSRGYLIGMNTMIYSKSGASDGIGFAVPSNTIARVVNQIIKYGRTKQPGLGIAYFDESISRQIGVEGVILRAVIDGEGAAKAGLRGTVRDRRGKIRLGDIIIAINGEPVKNYDDLYNVLEKFQIGDTVAVKYIRDGREHEVKVRLSDVNVK